MTWYDLFFYAVAMVEDNILCMHGGLSPDLKNLDQVYYTFVMCAIQHH